MSDARDSAASLPAAAIDITEFWRAVTSSLRPRRSIALGVTAFLIADVALVVSLVLLGSDSSIDGLGITTLIAVGVVASGVLLAALVILPTQLVTRRARRVRAEVDALLESTLRRCLDRFASIGYRIPEAVCRDWLTTAESTASVPLVHDSVIAARRWQPSADDDRVFLEAYLSSPTEQSTLPALPPVSR